MKNKETAQANIPEIKLSDEMASLMNSITNDMRYLIECSGLSDITNDMRYLIECSGLSDIGKVSKEYFELSDFGKVFKEVARLEAECERKRENNFNRTKEEESYKYGSRHWDDFNEWYKECVMFNPAYYDLPFGYILNTIDEVIAYTDPETNITLKIMGVNSVAYEEFWKYKEICHKRQRQGLKWSYEEEKERLEKFIKDVDVEHPEQIQDADEKNINKVLKAFEGKGAKRFFSEDDFIAFTNALAIHLSNKEYILPQPIKMRRGGIGKVAKAVYSAFLCTNGTSLSDDTKLFDLMKVLSYYRDKDNDKIILDMQRTK